MPAADFATLDTFFQTNQGGNFDWTHPITSTVYDVRFSQDTLEGEVVFHGHYQVTVEFEEV